jgi:ABC-type transport system involved in cytochrome bd biosynthesis fused ATPase/permease subunit
MRTPNASGIQFGPTCANVQTNGTGSCLVLTAALGLEQVDEAYLRRVVALITQQAYVFAGSVRDNLGYLQPQASQAEIEHAVAVVGLAETISCLGGYDAEVPPGGAPCPPGNASSSRWRGSTCPRPRS